MGLLHGGMSVMRFDLAPADKVIDLQKSIDSRIFVPLADHGDTMTSIGWVPIESPNNDHGIFIDKSMWMFGDKIALAVREDEFVINKAKLNALLKHRMDEAVFENGGDASDMGRNAKLTIKRACTLEMRAKSQPRSKIVELVVEGDVLMVFGKGSFVEDQVVPLFERTFARRAVFVSPTELAIKYCGENESKFKLLQKSIPSSFAS